MQNSASVENEKSPFLPNQKPVCLTPSWEEQKLPNDELNFKGLTMARAQMTLDPPKDRFKLVFLIFIIHGIGTLTSWNMFITAKSYFEDYKLAGSPYYYSFTSYLGLASQIPNVLFNWVNIFIPQRGDLTKRIVFSISFCICIFMLTVVLAMVDTSNMKGLFFWITMLSVVLLNVASGIYQNTIYGMVSILPVKYMGAVVLGSNVCGVFTTLVSISSTFIFSSKRTAAIYYFITAMLILMICFDTYFALPLNKFFKYHESLRKKDETVATTAVTPNTHVPYWTIFKTALPQLLNVFFVFFVTLSIFPAIHSDIKRSDENFFISDAKFFTDMTCFLTFNLFAMLGNLATSWVQWPKPQYLYIPVYLRFLLIPLFVFCNYLPGGAARTLPVLIKSDWIYWIIAIVHGLSSGYLSSLGMMYAPQTVAPQYQITAGMFAAAMLITGICAGLAFSLVFPLIATLSF